jgi:predicted DsbA family dithiol-disulfide isomerase
MADRRRAMFEQAGLPHAEPLTKVPNSRRALMLGELARDRGAFDALHPRLFDAYWARDRDIGEPQVLVEEGITAGLEERDIIDALDTQQYLARIQAETRTAVELGVTGVPAWLIDQRVLVPGAQPHEIFVRVLEHLRHAPLGG